MAILAIDRSGKFVDQFGFYRSEAFIKMERGVIKRQKRTTKRREVRLLCAPNWSLPIIWKQRLIAAFDSRKVAPDFIRASKNWSYCKQHNLVFWTHLNMTVINISNYWFYFIRSRIKLLICFCVGKRLRLFNQNHISARTNGTKWLTISSALRARRINFFLARIKEHPIELGLTYGMGWV